MLRDPFFQQWSKQASQAPTSYSISQEAVYRSHITICQFKRATVNFINFPNNGQTCLVSFNELLECCREFSLQYNGILYCRACVRGEAYTVLFARKGNLCVSHDIYADILILTESASDQSTVVIKRSSSQKRCYPPQFKHLPRTATARVPRDISP